MKESTGPGLRAVDDEVGGLEGLDRSLHRGTIDLHTDRVAGLLHVDLQGENTQTSTPINLQGCNLWQEKYLHIFLQNRLNFNFPYSRT